MLEKKELYEEKMRNVTEQKVTVVCCKVVSILLFIHLFICGLVENERYLSKLLTLFNLNPLS